MRSPLLQAVLLGALCAASLGFGGGSTSGEPPKARSQGVARNAQSAPVRRPTGRAVVGRRAPSAPTTTAPTLTRSQLEARVRLFTDGAFARSRSAALAPVARRRLPTPSSVQQRALRRMFEGLSPGQRQRLIEVGARLVSAVESGPDGAAMRDAMREFRTIYASTPRGARAVADGRLVTRDAMYLALASAQASALEIAEVLEAASCGPAEIREQIHELQALVEEGGPYPARVQLTRCVDGESRTQSVTFAGEEEVRATIASLEGALAELLAALQQAQQVVASVTQTMGAMLRASVEADGATIRNRRE